MYKIKVYHTFDQMTNFILKKIIFVTSDKYDKLWFYTAFALDQNSNETKLQGLSTPELAKVLKITFIK